MVPDSTPDERRVHLAALLTHLADAAPAEDGRPGRAVPLQGDLASAYAAALLDLLTFLGAVQWEPGRRAVRVTTVQGRYLLGLLADLLTSGESLVADWARAGVTPPGELNHPFGAGVDLLAALERRRLELAPEALPLREGLAAVGLIVRRQPSGEQAYLCFYDVPARAWQLPGGRFEQADRTLRRTLLRELSEELDCGPLVEPGDVRIEELGPPFDKTRLSPTYGLLTRTIFQVYRVHFVRALPPLHDGLRWVTEAEALAGQTADGLRVDTAPLQWALAERRT